MNPALIWTLAIVGHLAIGLIASVIHVHNLGKKHGDASRVGLVTSDFSEIFAWIFLWPFGILVLFILSPVCGMVLYWGFWLYNWIYLSGKNAGKPPTGTHPTAKEVDHGDDE